MPTKPCPPRECPQCWHHAHVLHAGNLLGLVLEPECPPCLDHMINGCPKPAPEKPKKFSWW